MSSLSLTTDLKLHQDAVSGNQVSPQRMRYPVIILLLILTGCHDHTPRVSKEQAQRALEKWLKDDGLPNPTRGFDQGQEGRVIVTNVYSFTPKYSVAELTFTDFKYRDYAGQVKSWTGKGRLDFNQADNNKWIIERMFFEGEGNQVLDEFLPRQKIEVE